MMTKLLVCFALLTPMTINAAQNERQPASGRPGAQSGRQAPQQAKTDRVTRIYKLKYSGAKQTSDVLSSVLSKSESDVAVISDTHTNSLIVAAAADSHQDIASLISELDVPASSTARSDEVSIIHIGNRDVNELSSRLHDLYRRELQVSTDESGRRILVRGGEAEIKTAQQLISQLDSELPTATVEFALLRINAEEDESTTAVPDDLKAVASEIERFGTPSLMGRLMTVAIEGEQFSVGGEIALNSQVRIDGKLLTASDDGSIKISVTAKLESRKFIGVLNNQNHGWTDSEFSVNTSVVVKRGDYVVLGSAPHGFKPGESVVLVVHVPAAH